MVLPTGKQFSMVKFPNGSYEAYSRVLTRSEVLHFFRLRYQRDPEEIQNCGPYWLAGPIPDDANDR